MSGLLGYEVLFDDLIITDDLDLNLENMINVTIVNQGDVALKVAKGEIPALETFALGSPTIPFAKQNLKLEFVGAGVKKAHISYGKIRKIPCKKDN